MAISLTFPFASLAQSSIPQDVIDSCNAKASAGDLPDCLRHSSIGFEMLTAVITDEFYGESASSVVEVCETTNDDYAGSWTCFKNAAEDAVDTKGLIGLENIQDQCIASISDEQTYADIKALYESRRSAVLTDQYSSYVTTYHPFQGCPVAAAEDPEAEVAEVGTPDQNENPDYDDEICAVYAEIEDVISSHSARQLRKMMDKTSSIDVLTSEQATDIFGLSQSSADRLTNKNQKQAVTSVALLGAFLNKHHPDLLDEYIERSFEENEEAGADIDPDFARAFMMSISAKHELSYRTSCG